MRGNLVEHEDLTAITGYVHAADVERCLQDLKIRYFRSKKGRLWTTVDLINAAGGLAPGQGADQAAAYDPQDVF